MKFTFGFLGFLFGTAILMCFLQAAFGVFGGTASFDSSSVQPTQSTPETDIETIARLRNKREAAEATEERQRRVMETLILIEQMKQK